MERMDNRKVIIIILIIITTTTTTTTTLGTHMLIALITISRGITITIMPTVRTMKVMNQA